MALNIKKDFGTARKLKPDLDKLILGKLPPQAPELEAAVLGAIMLEKDKFSEAIEIIQSGDCFYVDAHRRIYEAMHALNNQGRAIDLLTVTEELKKRGDLELIGGQYFLTTLTLNVVTSAHMEVHARIVMEKFIQRELIRISGTVISEAYEDSTDVFDLLDKAETGLYDITDKHLRKNYNKISDILIKTLDEINEAKANKKDVTGVPSGYATLDKITGGWQKSDLIVLAARPGMGKTAFTLNLALNAALNKDKPFPVAFFSLEMGAGQLVRRLLAAVSDLSLGKLVKGQLEEHEFYQLMERSKKLASAPIFIDDQAALNIFELRAKARRLASKSDIQMIIIDYLQLMTAGVEKGNREQEISKISRDLKALAKELNIPIIALSQLNRSVEQRSNSKIPQLSDLRESGAIEQDADMVVFLYRPGYYQKQDEQNNMEPDDGTTEVIIAKHRNGNLDTAKVKFIGEYQKFVNLDFDSMERQSFKPSHDNPMAGMRRDPGDFGASKLYTPDDSGFKTIRSKASEWTEDEKDNPQPPPEDTDMEAPF